MEELFEKIKVKTLKYKAKELPSIKSGKYVLPALTAGIENQGLNNYVPIEHATILKNVISISANGANTGATFYQSKQFTVLQDAYAIKWIFTDDVLSSNQYLFLTSILSSTIYGHYEWTNKAGWERVKKSNVKLPICGGKVDLDFMESFIAELEAERVKELEAYLKASGLDNYELTDEELDAIKNYKSIIWGKYNLEKLFGNATRSKRLKSLDRFPGRLPFVTAGEAKEGISAYISNRVQIFPENTITIDMFGSAKYRNYKYGADDHIAVVHTENIPKNSAIFITSAIHKSAHTGKFSYSKNFYAKDADALNIFLPTKRGNLDYKFMILLISAIQKLVIKDVVLYAENKIDATKKIIDDDTD